MKITLKGLSLAIASAGMLAIYGCGGGSSSAVVPTPAAQITGTAATGAALANASVAVTNSAGASPCVETSISTTDLGSYTCTLKTGEMAPFFIVVTDPTGQKAPLVSIAMQTPVAGTPLTVNATSLTTAIVAQLNVNGDALAVVAGKSVDTAALAAITAKVLDQLAPVTKAVNTPSDYNPFTTSITAATSANTGNTADQLLDMVKIGTDPSTGKLAFSTITDPTPVLLATATTAGGTVAAPTTSASDLSQAAQIAAKAFANCFALPTAQRVLATDTTITAANGGPEVTNAATVCQDIATNGSNARPAFLQNGYRAGQFFYSLLTSDTMTGAKFSVPEIMAFYPKDTANPNDRAVLNIRYLDKDGNPGNVISVAANIPSTTTTSRPSNWWLVGNQHAVDVSAKLMIRRIEQLNASNTTNPSRFQSGIQFLISTVGPNSASLTAAQVTGDGLPTNGLWYFKNAASPAAYMDISTYRNPSTPNAGAYTAVCVNCPNYWLGKTQGLTGTAATSYAANSTSLLWAQGIAEGSYNGATGIQPKKGANFVVKLYAGTTLSYTVKKTLLSDLVDPAQGSKLPWNTLGSLSQAALDPANSTLNSQQGSLKLDWVQNPAAQQIGSAAVTTTDAGAYSNSQGVAKGATSVTVTSSSTFQFTGLTGTPSGTNGYRSILFGHRMLDGSNKSAAFSYN